MTPEILVIDDDGALRETLRKLLESRGHRVETAADAAEGLRKAREGRFAVVLLDHVMPGRTGLDALPDLREAAPGAAILMLTAFGTLEIAKEAVRRGARNFLTKPIDPPALFAAVAEAASAAGRGDGPPPAVLVVEDDPSQAEALKKCLDGGGYVVEAALSGEAGLQRARERAFDILLVDMHLPDLDGLRLAERALTYHEAAPSFIFMTSRPTIPDAVRATQLGAAEYLAKPVEPRALLDLAAREVEKRKWQRLPEGLQPGRAYLLLEEAPEGAHGLFRSITGRGLRGIAFCRDPEPPFPPRPGVRVVALGDRGLSVPHVSDPVELFTKAEACCRPGPAVVLLDGFEYLASRAGFPKALAVLQALRDLAVSTRSLLLCAVNPGALGEREMALLRRELVPLDLRAEADRAERWERVRTTLPPDRGALYGLLMEAGGDLLQSDLAARCGFSRAKLTRLLDQLEADGLAVRRREGMGNRVLLT